MTDPSGLFWGEGTLGDIVDAGSSAASSVGDFLTSPSDLNPLYLGVNLLAEIPYGAYYVSYRTLSTVGSIPFIGKMLTYTAPFVGLYGVQYLGLKADEGIDRFKNWAFNNGEVAGDECGPIYPTPIHHGPQIYGPGMSPSGNEELYPKTSYPWQAGFSPSHSCGCP